MAIVQAQTFKFWEMLVRQWHRRIIVLNSPSDNSFVLIFILFFFFVLFFFFLPAIGHQNWEMISDFRVYSHMLPTDSSTWPQDMLVMPPINATRLRNWQDSVRVKTTNPSFVRTRLYHAGSLSCLNLVLRIADSVSIRRAAMCAVCNIACQPSLRHNIIQIDGFVDIILTLCSYTEPSAQSTLEDWQILELKDLVKYSRLAALALR